MSTYDADAVSDFTNHLFHSSFQPVTITAQHSNKNLYAQFKFTLQTISRFIRFFKSIRNQMKSEAIWSSASLFPSIFFAQQKQRYEKQRCLLRPPASDHRKTVIAAFIRVYTITSIARLISFLPRPLSFGLAPCVSSLIIGVSGFLIRGILMRLRRCCTPVGCLLPSQPTAFRLSSEAAHLLVLYHKIA